MAKWSESDIPDLTGKTAVVTGANSGLGLQTARALAQHGADVTLACRDQTRGEAAAKSIADVLPDANVDVELLDLADLSSVTDFTGAWQKSHDGLDILVNNAGVMALPYRTTRDGFEMQFGTNHLGHFALTGRLLPALKARPGARVVTVSSYVAIGGHIHFDDLQGRSHYNKWTAYAQSKLANLLFALELDRRLTARAADMLSVAAHPGYAATNLQSAGPRMVGSRARQAGATLLNTVFAQSDKQGALPSLFAATEPSVQAGEYFGPNQMFGTRGHPTKVKPPKQARDRERARRLWEVSENLTEVSYPF